MDLIKTNWKAVYNYLSDALDYLEDDSRESKMFRVQLEILIDRAWYDFESNK